MKPEQQIRTSSDSFSTEKKPQPKPTKATLYTYTLNQLCDYTEEVRASERAEMFLKYDTTDLCFNCQRFSKFVKDFDKDKKAELKKVKK